MGKSLAYCLKGLGLKPAETEHLIKRAKAYVDNQGMSQAEADATVAKEWRKELEGQYNSVLKQIKAGAAKAPAKERRVAGKKTREMYESIATKLKSAEEAREVIRELTGKVYTDELTGIGNRAAFFEELAKDEKLPEAERRHIVFCDLDNFSWVNDALSHTAGDQVLREVGAVLKEHGGKAVSRLGGEEFGALIKGERAARLAAEKIREIIENDIRIDFTINQPRRLKDGTIYERGEHITVAGIGVSYGIGKTYGAADERLQGEKEAREKQGIRSPKGAEAKRVKRRRPPGTGEGAEGKREQGPSFPEDVATFSTKVSRDLKAFEAVPDVSDKIIERIFRGQDKGFGATLRTAQGLKLPADMSAAEKLAEARDRIESDIKVALKEMKEGGDPIGYLVDRALDPLDELNEFYAEVLRRNTGAEVVAGDSVRFPRPAAIEEDADNLFNPDNWGEIEGVSEPPPVAVSGVSFQAPEYKTGGIEGLKTSVLTGMKTTGSLKAKSLWARTPAEVASLLAHIRKEAQENLYLVAVNKNDKIIEIHYYTKGTTSASQASVSEMASYAMNAGADKVYAVHNHPSTDPKPSADDIGLFARLRDALKLNDIELSPLILGGTKWMPVDPNAITAEDIPAAIKKKKLNVRERVFKLRKLGPVANNSASAISIKNDLFGADAEGFLLQDAQLQVLGFYEYPEGKTVKEGAAEFLKVIGKTNAKAIIFFSNIATGKPLTTRYKFLYDLKEALAREVQLNDFVVLGQSLRDANPNDRIWAKSRMAVDAYKALDTKDVLYSTKQAVDTESAEFKKWFGGSKIVDEKGRPQTVYHGTLADFDSFKPSDLSKFDATIGMHFAKDPQVSGVFSMGEYTLSHDAVISDSVPGRSWYRDEDGKIRYDGIIVLKHLETGAIEPYRSDLHGSPWEAGRKKDWSLRVAKPGGKILPVYLRIENPLVVDNKPNEWDEKAVAVAVADIVFANNKELFVDQVSRNIGMSDEVAAGAWEDIKSGRGWDYRKDMRLNSFKEVAEQWFGMMNGIDRNTFKKIMADAGYDGIIYNNTSRNETGKGVDPTSYIVFDPAQVKSSVSNTGEFSAEQPDISMSTKPRASVRVGPFTVKQEVYNEARGETGPFHDTWRIYNEVGDRTSRVYTSENAAVSAAKVMAEKLGSNRIANKWREKGVQLDLWEADKITLQMIEVPKEMRKQGIGTQIMQELVDYADRVGKRIELTPGLKDELHGTTSRGRLVKFYKRFEFKENKGRYKDFTTSAGMYREPAGAIPSVEGFETDKTESKRINDLLEKGEAYVTTMSPAAYLQSAADILGLDLEESDESLSDQTISRLRALMGMGEKMKTPFLDYREKDQEGRHRAAAALKSGLKEIPVVIVPASPEVREISAPYSVSKETELERRFEKGLDSLTLEDAADPNIFFMAKRYAEKKWQDIPFEETRFFKLNNRMARELEVFESIFGASPLAIELPGWGRLPARAIKPSDLLSEMYRVVESGEAAEILNPRYKLKEIAKSRGLSSRSPGKTIYGNRQKSPAEQFVYFGEFMRKGNLLVPADLAGKPTLSENAKAGRSADFMLATCDPTEQCSVCYVAETMIRQDTINKSIRNTIAIMMDPDKWSTRVSNEARVFRRPDLLFIRLQGSGDLTMIEQLEGYNQLAKKADRPIHIFSRHHEMLRELKGTAQAPFLRMTSTDMMLYNVYGHQFLTENAHKYGMSNAWLLTALEELPALEALYKEKALGLILASDKDLHTALPKKMREISCPCDAHERTYLSSCRQCALSQMGCMTAFRSFAIDGKGKLWQTEDPKMPKKVAPILTFLSGADPMTIGDFIMRRRGQGLNTKASRLALLARAKKELGRDPYTMSITATVEGYLNAALHIISKSIKLTEMSVRNVKKGKKKKYNLHDMRFMGDVTQTTDIDLVKQHLDFLRYLRDQAVMGKAYLQGGETQLPVAIKAGQLLADATLISEKDAYILNFSVKARGNDAKYRSEDLLVANGAGNIANPREPVLSVVKDLVTSGDRILDYGAGLPNGANRLPAVEALRKTGADVIAYEIGRNADPDVHDADALDKNYDIVYANNVLNVQNSPSAFDTTIGQLVKATTRKGGRLVVNMPEKRKGFLSRMSHEEALELVKSRLLEHFADVRAGEVNGKRDREILVASGKRQVLFSTKNAAAQVRNNPEFEKWFGASKVVDAKGNPRVMYHATNMVEIFTRFRSGRHDVGIHFGTAEQANDRLAYTRRFRDKTDERPRIYPVYLKMENPLRLPHDPGAFDVYNLPLALKESGEFTEQEIQELESHESNIYWAEDEGYFTSREEQQWAQRDAVADFVDATRALLKSKGFDGLVYANTGEIEGMSELMDRLYAAETDEERTKLYAEKEALEASDKVQDSYAVLDPKQIKSIFNRGTFDATSEDIMFSVKRAGWYSEMYNFLAKNLPKKGPRQNMINTIKAWSGKKFKAEELEWSGLIEDLESGLMPTDSLFPFFGKKKNIITKDEILDILDMNSLNLDEHERRDVSGEQIRQEALRHLEYDWDNLWSALIDSSFLDDEKMEELNDDYEDARSYYENDDSGPLSELLDYVRVEWGDFLDERQLYIGYVESYEGMARDSLQEMINEEGTQDAKFAQYVVGGGHDYRELIMTLNPILISRTDEEWKEYNELTDRLHVVSRRITSILKELDIVAEKYDWISNVSRQNRYHRTWESEQRRHPQAWKAAAPLLAELEKLRAEKVDLTERKRGMREHSGKIIGRYEPSAGHDHWDDLKNPILHIRFTTRRDVHGKLTLFIEEIQSDWHEQGHEKGYFTPFDQSKSNEEIGRDYYYKKHRRDVAVPWRELSSEDQDFYVNTALEEEIDRDDEQAPVAPWSNPNVWMMLGFKRMVRWAAQHGFDQIAWAPGHIHAARYSLGTYTDHVTITKDRMGRSDGIGDTYYIQARDMRNSGWRDAGSVKAKDLPATIGKELSRKVLESPADQTLWSFEGDDLFVGGAGMRKFYDEMLRNNVNNMFGKDAWGKSKVFNTVFSKKGARLDPEEKAPTREEIDQYIVEVEPGQFQIYTEDGNLANGGRRYDSYDDAYDLVQGSILEDRGFADPLTTMAIDVTDKMREKATAGMPLFSAKVSDLRPAGFSHELRDHLEKVATPEALRALTYREMGVPFYHEFKLRRAEEGLREGIIRRQYAELYGSPIEVKIGEETVAIGMDQPVTAEGFYSIKKSIESNPQIRPIAYEYVKMLEATMAPEASAEDMAENVLDALSPETRKRIEQPGGLKEPPFMTRLRAAVVTAKNSITRSYAELDPKNYGSVLNVLRLHQEVGENAARRAGTAIGNILRGLKPKQYTAFRMALIMDDMLKDIESGLLAPDTKEGETYPFGFKTEAEIRAYHKHVNDAVAADPLVKSALRRREKFNQKLKDLLVKHELLNEAVLDDDRYFHHQVLEYRALTSEGDQYYMGAGLGQRRLEYRKKGWQIARKGSLQDYNSDYAQAEFEVIAQAFLQLETMASLKRIQDLADYTERAKELAKADWDVVKQAAKDRAKAHKRATGEKKGYKEFMPADAKKPDWKDYIPEGYVAWKPALGSVWYKATTITDRMIDKIASGEIAIGEAKMREVWLKGKDPEWYLPAELARTLDNYGKSVADKHFMEKWSAAMLGKWKQWTLINPFRVVKYNVNNMSGDADIAFAYDPRILTHYFGAAMRDLVREYRGKGPVTWTEKGMRAFGLKAKELSDEIKKELELARRLGVLGSGWSVQELSELSQTLSYEEAVQAFAEDPSMFQRLGRGLKHTFWGRPKNITALRENILRLAAWRFFKDQLAQGALVYGASRKAEVDAIANLDEKAAKLGRDLIGDYGNISEAGQWIRKHMIPFYSWLEVNAPRYVRLMRNMKHEGKSTILLPAVMAKKMTWKTAALGVKMVAFMAMVNLFNATFFPDEEEELTEQQRRQMHLILGRRSDGSIRTLRIQGAFSDALAWFGAEDFPQDVRDLFSGRKSVGDWAMETVKAPWIKLFQGLRPGPKALYTFASGQSFYPEGPFETRPVRDQVEEIFRLFSLEKPYRIVAGKPRRGGSVAGRLWYDITSMAIYNNDPGESAYYQTTAWASEFMEKVGEADRGSYTPSDKSNALYYYKQALKYGDLKAAEKYLKIYVNKFGGTQKTLAQSIARAHPMAMIPSKMRDQFKGMLSTHQRHVLEMAEEWYHKTYKAGAARAIPWPQPERKPKTLRDFKLGE